MKKSLCIIFSILLLAGVMFCCLSVFCDGNLAYAATADTGYMLQVGNRNVYLAAIRDSNDNYVGVHMHENFFGDSFIPVEVNVYSSDNFVIDFAIGADAGSLTSTQQRTREALIDLFRDIVAYVDKIDSLANTQSAGLNGQAPTDVYRYNNASASDDRTEVVDGGYKIEIAPETYEMLTIAQEMYVATHGAFNPAVYRLVDLWGFSSRTYYINGNLPYDRQWADYSYPLPEQKYIDAFSAPKFVDFSEQAVELYESDGKYYVTKKVAPIQVDGVEYQQWIDLGGIAKGYVADMLKAKLYSKGIDRFTVDAGSSSLALGLNFNGDKTNLTVNNAFGFGSVMAVSVGKSSVSTSGQNLRKYAVNGVEYSHIIDGSAGAPAQTGVRSVTIVVPTENSSDLWATRGDCLTTALTVLGYNGIFDVMGDYLEQNGIKIVVQYETLNGKKQLLSTFDANVTSIVNDSYGELKWDERGFYYADYIEQDSNYAWVLIVLGCVLGALGVAMIVYHFARGKKRTAQNVQNAKKDKPFKVLDVMVYIGVVLVILVLFYVFLFNSESVPMQFVNVIDEQTGETLFTYNFVRGEFGFYDRANGWTVAKVSKEGATHALFNDWTIEVNATDDGFDVKFSKQIDGEQHFNKLTIVTTGEISVDMTDSICGYHQECVRNFDAIEHSGGVIVCSPNRLKVVAQ